jgi:hypothetical protein
LPEMRQVPPGLGKKTAGEGNQVDVPG